MTEFTRPPKALVLTAPGINRDHATKRAFELAGGNADVVHINQLIEREVSIDDYEVFSIPGGFSYGDHVQSGRILALKFSQHSVLSDQIEQHLQKGRLIVGVCNGFQVLVQSGLLPFGKIHDLQKNVATLTHNTPQRFQSRWIHLKPTQSNCFFVDNASQPTLPVAHGEGRFVTIDDELAEHLFQNNQIVYQYCTPQGVPTQDYPDNPNGSSMGIAAICDGTGQILGMMPHAEDFVIKNHHPNWRREQGMPIDGLNFFKNIVKAAKHL